MFATIKINKSKQCQVAADSSLIINSFLRVVAWPEVLNWRAQADPRLKKKKKEEEKVEVGNDSSNLLLEPSQSHVRERPSPP